MWRLVKADFRYNWHIFIFPSAMAFALLVFIGLILGWPKPEEDLAGTRSLLMALTAFVFFVRILRMMGEKRDRYHAMLPLSGKTIAFSRLLSVIFLWAGFVLLYWISTIIVKPYQSEIIIFEMLTVSGFVLMANAFPYMHRDISVFHHNVYLKTLLMIVYTAFMCMGTVLFLTLTVTESSWRIMRVLLPLKNYIFPLSTSFLGASLFLILGLGMTWLSIFLFKQRKAFVE